jgi:hypothetical protein
LTDASPPPQPLDPGDRIPIAVVEYSPPQGRERRLGPRTRWWPAAVAGVALLALAIVMTLVASVAVSVRTAPEVAEPRVDFAGGLVELRVGGRWLVLPGEYVLAVEADGYAPASQPVTVARGGANEFIVPLERLPGRVSFDTGGVAATLSVDGAPVGPLPGEYELPAGARAVRIEAPRHVPWAGEVVVAGGGEQQAVEVTLVPSYAAVSVTTVPAGATVRVDGDELGVTPLETTLDAGRYQLTLEHPRYRRFETPITVKAGEPLVIGPVELGVPDGVVALRSTPAGADVSVGGRYRGRTPLDVSLAPGVPHELVVSRAGYAPVTRSVSVASRERQALSVTLEAVLGEVTVRGQPADAQLYVDGAGARRGQPDAAPALGAARDRGAQGGPCDLPQHRHAAARPAAGGGVRADLARGGARGEPSRARSAPPPARSSGSCAAGGSRWAARGASRAGAPTRRSAAWS